MLNIFRRVLSSVGLLRKKTDLTPEEETLPSVDSRERLRQELISHIHSQSHLFTTYGKNPETGLPGWEEITTVVEKQLFELGSHYSGVTVSFRGDVPTLTYPSKNGQKRSAEGKRGAWFHSVTIKRFLLRLWNAEREKMTSTYDLVSLYLGFAGFDGFKDGDKLAALTLLEEKIEENPREGQESNVEINIKLRRAIFNWTFSKKGLGTILLVFGVVTALSIVWILSIEQRKNECNSEKESTSAIIMEFDKEGKEPFSTRLINEIRGRVTQSHPLRVLFGQNFIDTRSSNFKQDVEEVCQSNCFGKGVIVYGNFEGEFEFVDCHVETRNLTKNDLVVSETHYYIKDPGGYNFNIPKRASIVADFIWALLNYYDNKEETAISLLGSLLATSDESLEESFVSSVHLLIGNSYLHLGDFNAAIEEYQKVSQTDQNWDIAKQNLDLCLAQQHTSGNFNGTSYHGDTVNFPPPVPASKPRRNKSEKEPQKTEDSDSTDAHIPFQRIASRGSSIFDSLEVLPPPNKERELEYKSPSKEVFFEYQRLHPLNQRLILSEETRLLRLGDGYCVKIKAKNLEKSTAILQLHPFGVSKIEAELTLVRFKDFIKPIKNCLRCMDCSFFLPTNDMINKYAVGFVVRGFDAKKRSTFTEYVLLPKYMEENGQELISKAKQLFEK